MESTYMLRKEIMLYKVQFDKFTHTIFGGYDLDRLSIELDGLSFKIKYMIRHQKDLDKIDNMKKEFSEKALELRKAFGTFMYRFLNDIITIPQGSSIKDLIAQDVKIDTIHVKFEMMIISDDQKLLEYIDNKIDSSKVYNMFPDEYFRYQTDSYNDAIAKAYPELFENRHQDTIGTGADGDVFVHNFTFQTSEKCSLNCFPAGTKILMADFSHKDIKDIQVGDEVIGFEEFGNFKKQRTLIPTKVTKISSHYESCYKISHPDIPDTYATPEHPFLTARGEWIMTKDIRPSDGLMVTNFYPDDFFDTDIDSLSYVKGYFLSGFMGDGCAIENTEKDGYKRRFMRFAVKDTEMYERMKKYSEILGFKFTIIPYKISEKFNIITDALYSGKKDVYDHWISFKNECINNNELMNDLNFLMGFIAGMYDAEGSIDGSCIRIHNSDLIMHKIVQKGLEKIHIKYDFDKPRTPVNKTVYTLRVLGGSMAILKFLKSIKPAISRKGVKNLLNKSLFHRIDGYSVKYIRDAKKVYNFETTEHTYIANRMQVHNCTYCYQFNKSEMRMSFDIAKKFIDDLLVDKYGYINRYNSPAIIIEFIGGEPLLEIKLTRKIYEYFLEKCYEMNHPWFILHRLSICSNGLQYFDDEVQSFFKDYAQNVSFNISIDGNKELHDSCRIQPNGEGSYDIDMAALNHFNKHYTPERNSKMTLAPSNLKYLFDSVVDFIDKGTKVINLNCVFEEGWNQETAREEYYQLKKLADYIIDNGLDNIYIAIFNERPEGPQDQYSDGNFCGGLGAMLSLRPNGDFYPCIRYMPTSVGPNVKDLCIGNVYDGIKGREQGSEVLQMMDNITRRSQSNDICYDCPISNDCSWCSALGHTVYGTPNKRPIFACIQMIAEALANVYYWNRLLLKHPEYNLDVRHNMVPTEWALLVIDQDELDELTLLESYAIASSIKQPTEM